MGSPVQMVDVTCPGCSASYSLSAKRIPEHGMEMRCPQCSTTFRVERPGGAVVPLAKRALSSAPPPPRKHRSLFSSSAAPPNEEFHSAAVDDLFGEADGDGDGEFGVIDMALPGTDLPLTSPSNVAGDLPMVAADLDLPIAVGDLDLPEVAADAGLPAVVHEAGLPAVVHEAGLPAVVHEAGLPAVAHEAGLPAVVHEAGLPAVAHEAGLPAVAHEAGLPAVAHEAGLPMRRAAPGRARRAGQPQLDDLTDLPLPSSFGNLPSPVGHRDLPMHAAHGDLPMHAAHGDLPLPADQDLPLPAPNGDLPLPADFNLPSTSDGPADSQPFKPDFQQFELAEDPHARLGQTEPLHDAIQTAEPDGPGKPPGLDSDANDSFGDEFDLEGAAERKRPTSSGGAPKVRLKRKPSKVRKAAFVAIPLLAIAGGMLYMVPSIGPFGTHAISDYIQRGDHDAAHARLSQQITEQLGLDTAAGAKATTARAQTMTRDMPRYTPVMATAAFLAFWNEIRFGTGSQDVAAGKLLLTSLKDRESGPDRKLAFIAQQAAGGDPDRAYSAASSYAQRFADRLAGHALAGEMALRTKKPKAALSHYLTLNEMGASALGAYGMARAHMAQGQHKKAQQHAEQALQLSKNHAGARTLLATILWTQNNKDERPLKLVQEVVNNGPVREAASRAELVLAHSLLGEIHLSRAHMTDAEKAFALALKMDPQSQRALLGNGEMLFQAGRYSEALARFEAAHRPNPAAELPLVGKAKTKIALERAADAKADLLPIAKASKHPLVGYWLGRAEEAVGNNKEAEKWYRHALKTGASHPAAVLAYVALADMLRGQGRHQEAAEVLADAGKNLPRSVALHNARGDVALTSGRVADAKREFSSALEIDPTFTPSRFRLATALRRNRELDAAATELEKVIDGDPEYPGLALERGLLFEARGETDKALAMYNEALEKAPDDDDLKLRVGSTQVGSGHPQQAAKLLREVLTKRPRSAEVNHFLGRAQLLNGDYLDALRYLQTAVRYDANRADYHLYVAWAANEGGQVAVASKAVDKALELDQQLGDGYWQRAIVKQKYSRTRDALTDLERALELNPTRYEAYATMALCYQDQANYSGAEEAWRKAISGDDKVAEWRFRLGKILADRGASEPAAKHLEAAVALAKTSKRPTGWLWNAHLLLGESIRRSNPKRAIEAYRAFIRLSSADNAYRADAERALAQLEK